MPRDANGRFAKSTPAVLDPPTQRNGSGEQYQRGVAQPPGPVVDSVFDVQRAIMRLASNILVQSDMAIRRDKTLQRMMRHDPDVMSPLLQRQYALALLDWDIVPEDEDDETQAEQAKALKLNIEHNLRRRHDMIRHLDEAPWYGPSAVNMLYTVGVSRTNRQAEGSDVAVVGEREIIPKGWVPFHPDSLSFDDHGALALKVGRTYKGDTIPGENGPVHMLSDLERQATVLHVFMPQAPDYEEAREARYQYAGRGLRDICYFFWFIKQNALQDWVTFLDRYSMGIRKAWYPEGNDPIKEEVTTVVRNMMGDMTVRLPRDQDGNPLADIDIVDPQSSGRQNPYADLVEGYLAGQLKEMIIGQTATTEATATGLGSDVGTRHAQTKNDIVKYDAAILSDTLTHELVIPLSQMNYGDTPWYPRWVSNVEEVDSDEYLSGVERAVELGVEIAQRDIRKKLGFPEPKEGEPLALSKAEQGAAGGAFGDDFFGGGGGMDFARVREEAARFRKMVSA